MITMICPRKAFKLPTVIVKTLFSPMQIYTSISMLGYNGISGVFCVLSGARGDVVWGYFQQK